MAFLCKVETVLAYIVCKEEAQEMIDNIIIWLFIILIVFSTVMVGMMALICMHILKCMINLYSECVKMRRKG